MMRLSYKNENEECKIQKRLKPENKGESWRIILFFFEKIYFKVIRIHSYIPMKKASDKTYAKIIQ